MSSELIDGLWYDRSDDERAWARFSHDRTKRYLLGRQLDFGASLGRTRVLWIMLNPSTAGAFHGDPTIRRVCSFSVAWGYVTAIVVNLFPHVTTDPRFLERMTPHEPMAMAVNDHDFVEHEIRRVDRIVCAWGAHPIAETRTPRLAQLLERRHPRADVVCLGYTKHGAPRHPLYLAKHTRPEPFTFTPITDRIEGT